MKRLAGGAIRIVFLLAVHFAALAQTVDSTSIQGDSGLPAAPSAWSLREALRNVHMNLLLRSSLEVPDGPAPASFRQNEARFEVLGAIVPNLDFRVRYRLNRAQAPRSLDNSPASIDIASVKYAFGKERKWFIEVGKQAAFVGSWEFELNPTFEYQYSDFVNTQLNLFMMGMKLGYAATENHSFFLQAHNTYNEGFAQAHALAGYSPEGEKTSKFPVGAYAAWQGKMFDKRVQTFWSYNISEFAAGRLNHSLALGNKLVLRRLSAYLDLQTANLAFDYPNLASPSVNKFVLMATLEADPVFAKDVNYKSAILRVDYQFIPKWFFTGKGIFESASHNRDNSVLGQNFRNNIGFLAGLEYQPISTQQMKMFGYYYRNTVSYNGAVATANANTTLNLFAVGILYFVNVF